MINIVRNSLTLAILAVFLSGCAVTYEVALPQQTATTDLSDIGQGRSVFVSTPFSDTRFDKSHCGESNSRLTPSCGEPPAQWLERLLIQELSDRGFDVQTERGNGASSGLRLEGFLQRFTFTTGNDTALSAVALASVRVKLTSQHGGSDAVNSKTFRVEGMSNPTYVRIRPLHFSQAAGDALAKVMPQLVAQVEEWPE